MDITISNEVVTLLECPIGLFVIEDCGELCVKTEYGNNQGGVDCYIVSSGEYLSCGGKTANSDGCRTVLVIPVSVE